MTRPHRHRWNVAGAQPVGAVRSCEICGGRQVKLVRLDGHGVFWNHLDDELETLLATDPERARELRELRSREGALASLEGR